MRGTKHPEGQIIEILKEAEKALTTAEVCLTAHKRADVISLEGPRGGEARIVVEEAISTGLRLFGTKQGP